MNLRLLDDLTHHAVTRPDAVAALSVGSPARFLTYQDLHRRVTDLAAILRARVQDNSVVLLCGTNRPSYVTSFLGVLAAGNTVFPLSGDLTESELVLAARRSGAAAAIVTHSQTHPLRSQFRAGVQLDDEDGMELVIEPTWDAVERAGAALLLQSSGTTAEPKIARRDGRSLDAVSHAMVKACHFGPDDHVLAAVPLCHSYGLEHGLLAPISAGSCIHVCEKFEPASVMVELRERGITLLPGVPFMFDMLARAQGAAFPTLRRAYSAGGPLPRATFDAFLAKSGLRIGQVYGATEIGSVTFNDPDSTSFDPSGVGVAMEGVDLRILDPTVPRLDQPLRDGTEGQVAVLARSMMSGYIDGQSAPLLNGYYLTGDLGVLNERGSLTITGRLKLLIDVGGRKVNPAEVEGVLRQHPGVASCVVVPLRLSETVCRVKAIVTPADPGAHLSAGDLRAFARQRLSGYKVPRVIEIRDDLPVSPAGKVLRTRVETS
jgi:acyl-CoA synthetase (AMP-forming)/AMP-acid ligase II